MTDPQQTTKLNDVDLWKQLKESSAMELIIPDPEIVKSIKKFYPQKEGLIK